MFIIVEINTIINRSVILCVYYFGPLFMKIQREKAKSILPRLQMKEIYCISTFSITNFNLWNRKKSGFGYRR